MQDIEIIWLTWLPGLTIIRAAEIENGLGKTSKVVKDEIYKVNNVGEWVGENAMGQILTMAKLALNEGIQMPIDEQLLNNAHINWFGKVLHFSKDADGSVTVEAVARSKRSKELTKASETKTVEAPKEATPEQTPSEQTPRAVPARAPSLRRARRPDVPIRAAWPSCPYRNRRKPQPCLSSLRTHPVHVHGL